MANLLYMAPTLTPRVDRKPAVEVVGLGKRFRALRTVEFAPATSIFRTIFDRAGAVAAGIDEYVGADEDDEDDEDVDVDEEEDRRSDETAADGEHVWALRNVSFTAERGTAVGILGSSGSGKSALLRIIARLTRPTEGRVVLRGSVAPPPEALAAFMRPELSARQNLRLAPRLFGLGGAIPSGRAQEIVAFAGLDGERFHAAPDANARLRRLAFAALLHSNVDVLLLDGFPKLGDPSLERHALKLLEERIREGATLLLASADRDFIEQLCTHVLVLVGGRVVTFGDVDSVLSRRSATGPPVARGAAEVTDDLHHSSPARQKSEELRSRSVDLRSADILAGEGAVAAPVGFNRWVALISADAQVENGAADVQVRLEIAAPHVVVRCSIMLEGESGRFSIEEPHGRVYPERGLHTLVVRFPAYNLPAGTYVGRVSARITIKGRSSTVLRERAFEMRICAAEHGTEIRSISEGDLTDLGGLATWDVEPRPSLPEK
jgi:ABC-type polysaccharide/polyol phosphate transport system ATPase subunit